MLRSVSVRHVTDSTPKPNDDRPVVLKARRHLACTPNVRLSARTLLRKRPFSVHASSSLNTAQQNGKSRSKLDSSRIQVSRVIFEALAKALVNGQFSRPVDLFTTLHDMKLLTTVNQSNTLLMQLLNLQAASAMFELLKFIKWKKLELNENTYTTIISACKIESDLKRAGFYFEQLKQSPDIPVTIRSYQAIITACIECDDCVRARKYFDEMLEVGIRVDTASFQRVFRNLGYSKKRPSEAAQLCAAVVKEMEKQGVELTPEICHSAAWTFSNAGDAESLLSQHEVTQKSDITLELPIYNHLLNLLSKTAGRLEVAARLFEDMKKTGVQPNEFTYGFMLRACAVVYDEVRSLALLEEMEEFGVMPNRVIYNSVINSFTRTFPEGEREDVWKKLEDLLSRMTAQGIDPDQRTYKALLSVCVVNGDRDRAERFFEEMQTKEIPRDGGIYAKMIKLYAEGSDLDDTSSDTERISVLLEQMEQEGSQLDAGGCSQITWSLINSKSMERAEPVLKHLLEHEVHYERQLLEPLLMFCLTVDKPDMMADFVDRAAEQNELSPYVFHHILLRALARFNKTAAVMEQLEKMKADGSGFSMATHHAINELRESDVSEEERSKINDILGPYSPFRQS